MSKDTIHHQVRQTLMNELGLTREAVRGMMEEIITITVSKHMEKLKSNDFIAEIIRAELVKMSIDEYSTFRSKSIKDIVCEEAKRQVEEFVKDNLRITA